jgi:hypothetical protein
MEEDEPPPPGLEEGKGGDDSCAEDEDKNRHKKMDTNDDKEEEDEDSKKEEKYDDPEDSVSYTDVQFLLFSSSLNYDLHVHRMYTPVQTGPGAHPASYTMGTGSLSRE